MGGGGVGGVGDLLGWPQSLLKAQLSSFRGETQVYPDPGAAQKLFRFPA